MERSERNLPKTLVSYPSRIKDNPWSERQPVGGQEGFKLCSIRLGSDSSNECHYDSSSPKLKTEDRSVSRINPCKTSSPSTRKSTPRYQDTYLFLPTVLIYFYPININAPRTIVGFEETSACLVFVTFRQAENLELEVVNFTPIGPGTSDLHWLLWFECNYSLSFSRFIEFLSWSDIICR